MSTTPPAAPPADAKETKGDHRKSLGKYVKRMSSVFRRERTTKTKGSGPTTPTLPESSTGAPAAIAEDQEAATASPAADPVDIAPYDAAAPAAEPSKPDEVPVQPIMQRSALQQERARALFAKYGLTLESHEWIAAPAMPVNVQRIEKPIRMRVHRTCHRCGTTYGADKVCAKCEHKRCKQCPRYPKKKTPLEKAQSQKQSDVAAAKALPKKKRVLTVPTRTGGELAYQPAKQRVRRNCHKCQALFIPPTATICEGCRHIRCTKCPREPAKLNKWPNGYPGDVEYDSDTEMERELERSKRIWRKPRTRVRWECDHCNTTFLDGSPQCPGCGHEKCEKCLRKPIKRVKPQRSFDPQVVKSVEAKLQKLQMHDERLSPQPLDEESTS
ncbi:uncharacterized protein CC84DRAFT_449061 [Paraphaeosphaeria sporulosa]|uniref:Uncharacterized protein n=1 Tax=Paraphaeosphaeria sporulosa TaxID=1460663 RepID=A0A177CSD5_9PLEO|nr:uncharacterized protein CC84DRAFT_449061 [Paraphaeosphaeria sporulosa]OAG09669.1 hypothetical protein CC84DRAFT_449061 [Paraphaeosphaeria sporulosa]